MANHIFRKITILENDSNINLSANEILLKIKDISSELQGKIEDVTLRFLRKTINHLKLGNEFRSYAKSFPSIDEKNVCTFFLQEHLSELLSSVIKHGKIFETEEEDKTNRKHRKQKKEMIKYVGKIREIDYLFNDDFKKSCNGGKPCFYYYENKY